MIKILLILAVCLAGCHGFKSGAPADVCMTMFPSHGIGEQNTPAPYTLTVNTTSYTWNRAVEVTLQATSPVDFFFEGFFVQARRADCSYAGVAIGNFTLASPDSEMKVMKCSGDNGPYNAVTHTSSAHKTMKKFIWTNSNGEDVFFQATVVNHKTTFWTEVTSDYVYSSARNGRPNYWPCDEKVIPVAAASIAGLSAWLSAMVMVLLAF